MASQELSKEIKLEESNTELNIESKIEANEEMNNSEFEHDTDTTNIESSVSLVSMINVHEPRAENLMRLSKRDALLPWDQISFQNAPSPGFAKLGMTTTWLSPRQVFASGNWPDEVGYEYSINRQEKMEPLAGFSPAWDHYPPRLLPTLWN